MNTARRTLALVVAAGALVGLEAPARGAVVVAMDFDQLAAEAHRVVLGEVVDLSPRWSADKTIIETVVEVRVETELSAASAGPLVRIVQPGGVLGDVGLAVPGMPEFRQGERALLFLRVTGTDPDGTTTHSVVGLAQGKFTVLPRLGGGFDAVQQYPDGLALAFPDANGTLCAVDRVRPIALDLEEALDRIRCVRGEVTP
ncbi:MAG: hypothetical protein JXB32_23965 [Deltaproteobacteria bacterium]|nr:hypothetical protein [Deltaproteobacteria bacterium]